MFWTIIHIMVYWWQECTDWTDQNWILKNALNKRKSNKLENNQLISANTFKQ